MTNKEAKGKLHLQWQAFLEHNLDYDGTSDAYKMAFKALEQMDILDKIRAEIEQTSETVNGFLMHDGTKRTVLQIIDKYREGSE